MQISESSEEPQSLAMSSQRSVWLRLSAATRNIACQAHHHTRLALPWNTLLAGVL